MSIGITDEEQKIIIDILDKYKEYLFYFYGSRVKGTYEKTSDLDILIKGKQEMPLNTLEGIKQAFDESKLPYIVNLSDYHSINENFYKKIEKDLFPYDWKECKIEEITDILGDGLHSTPIYTENGEYAFVNGNNLVNGHIEIKTDTKRVSESEFIKYKKPLSDRTLLVSINGTLGNVAEYNNEKIILGKSACYFNLKNNVSKSFIKYVLLSKTFQNYLENNATGTTIKNISLKQMREYKFLLPPLETQQKIAKVLSAIDDKIELNNSINNNLEQQAQAIFKSWFIDFEPFCGTMPEDWNLIKLEDATSQIIRGCTTKYVEKSNLINLNQKVNKGTFLDKQYYKYLNENIPIPKDKYAKKGDILLNSLGQGTLGRIHYWNEDVQNVVVDQHITIIREKTMISTSEFLYLLLSSNKYKEYFEGCITGTTGMLMLNISAVRNTDLYLPDYDIQQNFSNIIKPMYKAIEKNIKENSHLTQLRDTLLPKLMSGEIDVDKVIAY